jgi:hypothetical protein
MEARHVWEAGSREARVVHTGAQVSVCAEVRVVRRARAGGVRVPATVPVGVGQGRNGRHGLGSVVWAFTLIDLLF